MPTKLRKKLNFAIPIELANDVMQKSLMMVELFVNLLRVQKVIFYLAMERV